MPHRYIRRRRVCSVYLASAVLPMGMVDISATLLTTSRCEVALAPVILPVLDRCNRFVHQTLMPSVGSKNHFCYEALAHKAE